MGHFNKAALSLALPLLILPCLAQAEEGCLPALVPTVVDLTHNTQQHLVVLDKMLSQDSRGKNTGIGATYGKSSFNFSQSQQVNSSLDRLLQVDYKKDESENIYISSLSDAGVKAYIACIGKQSDISVTFPDDLFSGKSFFISANWHPTYRVDSKNQQGTAEVTQGKFTKTDKKTIDFTIRDKDSAILGVERNPYEATQIAITIDGKTKIINIPGKSPYGIVTEVIQSEPFDVTTRETSGDVGRDICVDLKNDEQDAALIPGTYQFVFAIKQAAGVTIQDHNPVNESERSACSHLGLIFNTVFKSFVQVKATAQALAFHAVRIDRQ